MPSSNEFEVSHRRNIEQRRAFINRWAEYVRTHDDEEWSQYQNTLIDSQLQGANDLARQGATDPVAFVSTRDKLRDTTDSR